MSSKPKVELSNRRSGGEIDPKLEDDPNTFWHCKLSYDDGFIYVIAMSQLSEDAVTKEIATSQRLRGFHRALQTIGVSRLSVDSNTKVVTKLDGGLIVEKGKVDFVVTN